MAEKDEKKIKDSINEMLQNSNPSEAQAPAADAQPETSAQPDVSTAQDQSDVGLLAADQSESGTKISASENAQEAAPDAAEMDTQAAETDTQTESAKSVDTQQDEDSIPIKDWNAIKDKLQLPDGLQIDQNLMEKFGKLAVEQGLSKNQAQKLISLQTQYILDAKQQQFDQGVAQLKQDWGDNAEAFRNQTLEYISKIDRMTNGTFSNALHESGADMNPNMIKCLHTMSKMISEDAFGAGKPGASADNQKISIEDMLRNAAEQQQNSRR